MTNENRIDKKFSLLRDENKKALITFITFGDPDIETSKKLVLEMEKEGADLIEIGVPFSDPMAEGPVIQAANVRALKNEINLDKIFKAVSELRQETEIPLVFLMYFNSLLSYGIEDFFKNLFQGTAYSTLKHAPVTAYGSNIRNIGLLIGSLISILFSKRFSIKKIRFGKQVLVSEGYYK